MHCILGKGHVKGRVKSGAIVHIVGKGGHSVRKIAKNNGGSRQKPA